MIKHLLITILSFSALILSCKEKNHKENKSIAQISKVTHNQTDAIRNKKQNASDILFTNGTPEITSLPFWSKGWPKPGKIFRTEHKIFRLPVIKSTRYINLDSIHGYICTSGKPIDSSLLKLTQYKYKFPNIGKYQAYYMYHQSAATAKDALLDYIKNTCGNMNYSDFGYIILFDPITFNATVLNVSNSFYIDSDWQRFFFIDKNYAIHLIDQNWTDGDEDSHGNQTTEYLGSKKRTIVILNNGEIKISDNK